MSGGIITTIAGTGTPGFSGDGGQATSAQFNRPNGVALDAAGNLYIGDFENNRIRKLSRGMITTIAGTGTAGATGDGRPGIVGQAQWPLPPAASIRQGSLYISDEQNHRVRKIENKPPVASLNASPSSGQAPLNVVFDGSGSSDPDGSVVSYSWVFGDGVTASGANPGHLYVRLGRFRRS